MLLEQTPTQLISDKAHGRMFGMLGKDLGCPDKQTPAFCRIQSSIHRRKKQSRTSRLYYSAATVRFLISTSSSYKAIKPNYELTVVNNCLLITSTLTKRVRRTAQ